MGILKGIIDRFRAMGKTEKEISGIIKTAADKATANPDVMKPEKTEKLLQHRHSRSSVVDSGLFHLSRTAMPRRHGVQIRLCGCSALLRHHLDMAREKRHHSRREPDKSR